MVMLSEDAEFCGDVNGWIRKKSMSVVLGFFVVVSVVFLGTPTQGRERPLYFFLLHLITIYQTTVQIHTDCDQGRQVFSRNGKTALGNIEFIQTTKCHTVIKILHVTFFPTILI